MRTFVRKCGNVIESFESKNVHTAVKFLKENEKIPCHLITKYGYKDQKCKVWYIDFEGNILKG